jgi:hypothetical protein
MQIVYTYVKYLKAFFLLKDDSFSFKIFDFFSHE